MSNFGRDALWDAATWSELDQAVSEELDRVRVARKVFRTEDLGASGAPPSWVSVAEIQTEQDGPVTRFIPEDEARPFVEISAPFWLTPAQAEAEETLHTARTLARATAKVLGLVEDRIILGGAEAVPKEWQVHARNADGLQALAIVDDNRKLERVKRGDDDKGPRSLVDIVNDGITKLTADGWAGPYALILGQDVYSEASSPLYKHSAKTAADQLAPNVRHCLLSGALKKAEGILVSLAGDPVTIYTAGEASVSFSGEELGSSGVFYRFRVVQRIQYAVTDRSCIWLIDLSDPAGPPGAQPPEAGTGEQATGAEEQENGTGGQSESGPTAL